VEVLEVIFTLIQACGCFLDIMTVGTNVGAGVAGVKAYHAHKVRRKAQERGEPIAPNNRWVLVFLALLSAGLLLLCLTVWKYAR
jgi:hypothetical protein